jgi:hypothetical protein
MIISRMPNPIRPRQPTPFADNPRTGSFFDFVIGNLRGMVNFE